MMREVYRRYFAARPDLFGVLLPDLLPHEVCGAAPPGRVKVLFLAESPPWVAGRHEVAVAADCRRPDYPYFWNDRYEAGALRGPLAGELAENLFYLLGLDGESRRENLALFIEDGFFLVDTVKCIFRKNRKGVIPVDLVRLSAREILEAEIAALAPEYVVALGGTALSGLRMIEPYATALAGAGTIIEVSREGLLEKPRLLCLPYPGWRNRQHQDLIESGFSTLRDLVA